MKAFEWTNPTTVNEAVKMLTVASPGDIDEAPRPIAGGQDLLTTMKDYTSRPVRVVNLKNIRGLKQIRFWMTFSDNYIKHLDVLQDVGMTRIDEVEMISMLMPASASASNMSAATPGWVFIPAPTSDTFAMPGSVVTPSASPSKPPSRTG